MVAAAAIGLVVLARRDTALDLRPVLSSLGRVVTAATVAGGSTAIALSLSGPSRPTGWPAVGIAIAAALGVLGIYTAVLAAMRAPELDALRTTIRDLARRLRDARRSL